MGEFVVGIARCGTYERDEVRAVLRLAVERAGGLPPISSPEVLVKANLLSPSEPEKAVTTHPEVLRAIIGELGGVGVRVADNPGYVFADAGALMRKTGMSSLAEMDGVSVGILSDLGLRGVSGESFRALKDARIASRYLDAGYCINAPKLKTHVETEMTGCIKNIFGTADTGTRKSAHASVSRKRLAEAIVDLFSIRPPEFNILDAVVGMEGDGPSHGVPAKIGFIVAGRNALAVDWAASAIMGYSNPADIPLIAAAIERGIGPGRRSDITLNGAGWDELPVKGFKKSGGFVRALPAFLRGAVHKLVLITPKLSETGCVGCWICKKVCPVDAISSDGRYPRIDGKKCVRCLCCHEMCPTGAMAVRKNFLAALASRMHRGDG
ncbi:MAG: DUF362 domain-containing protein [Synergistaceae bacterium]|jgi:uncharacterized protein (DUF362 family)/Pyruvate/2-oxoacid:ferredoxin oxidoreductase delta subunit|nr:DUF362 domain-containing protein [Synergistaceae bacterium]